MTAFGQANYDGYREFSLGTSLVSGKPIPEWDQVPVHIQSGWDAGADNVLALAEQQRTAAGQSALVEQLGHRSMVGQVREVTYLGKPMLEVRRLDTVPAVTVRISPDSIYAVTDLTPEQADALSRTYGRYNGLDAAGVLTRYISEHRQAITAAADDDAVDADIVDDDEDGYPDSEDDMDRLACQRNGDDERDDQ